MPRAPYRTRLTMACRRRTDRRCLLSSGLEIEPDFREIEHPEGRFVRADGRRYDVCIMDAKCDPGIRCPGLGDTFIGDRKDTEGSVVRIGFHDWTRSRYIHRVIIEE